MHTLLGAAIDFEMASRKESVRIVANRQESGAIGIGGGRSSDRPLDSG